jgi:hypothetical protein
VGLNERRKKMKLRDEVAGVNAFLGARVASFEVDLKSAVRHTEVTNAVVDALLEKMTDMGAEGVEVVSLVRSAVPLAAQSFALVSPRPDALGVRLYIMISYLWLTRSVPHFEWPWEEGGSRAS